MQHGGCNIPDIRRNGASKLFELVTLIITKDLGTVIYNQNIGYFYKPKCYGQYSYYLESMIINGGSTILGLAFLIITRLSNHIQF